MDNLDLSSLTLKEKAELLATLEEKENYILHNKLEFLFPDETRNGYYKHLSFFEAGATFRQRALIASNRSGKSYAGCYELACHLTGWYPHFWKGRRFDSPIEAWVVGSTSEVVRDTTQAELLGPSKEKLGQGMIPLKNIVQGSITYNAHRADTIAIRHSSGGYSLLGFKSDSAGVDSFMGTAKHVILCDEEISLPVYLECLTRTTTTNGIMMATWTPLKGLTDLVLSFLENGDISTPKPGVSVTTIAWGVETPHLTPEVCAEMLAALPPHQRLARSQGIPQIGSGAVYSIDPSMYICEPFEIPRHWLRVAGFDVGWKHNACIWGAIDPNDQKLYIYSEYYSGEKEPSIHAHNIKLRGDVVINIDTAARGRSQADGHTLYDLYSDLGLNLVNAIKCVETGIYTCYEGLINDRIKIFSNLSNILSEAKTYRRDDKGTIIKKNDHCLDAFRYLVMGKDKAKPLTPKIVDSTQYSVVSPQYRTSF